MKKPVISVDIDDVIADSTEALRHTVNRRFGVALTRADYRTPGEYWGYYEQVWSKAGLPGVSLAAVDEGMTVDQSHIRVIEDAKRVLSNLSKEHELVLVTSRDLAWREATERWVQQHFGDTFKDLYFTGHRKAADYRSKGELCAWLGASVHIDDHVDHCLGVSGQGIGAILFGEYGWHVDVPDAQVRCRTWREVEEHLGVRA